MCGIIGYVGAREAVPLLVSGLHRLEYRGYDSAGIAVRTRGGKLRAHKACGRIGDLEAALPARLRGCSGIGHTRWATHGEPSDANAHPHVDDAGDVAVVHNGIIENAAALRARLQAEGCTFRSETDSEVLVHLIARAEGADLEERVRTALGAVQGTYGIAVVDRREADRIVVARNGSPVILGIGDREMFVASDVSALVRHTQQVVHLDDGEIAAIERAGYRTQTLDARPTTREPAELTWGQEAWDRGEHPHFMHKEIFEQPDAVARTLSGRLDRRFATAHLGGLPLEARELLEVRRIKILGCGSACYAGQGGAHLLEALARIPADAEPAPEFRYRNPVIEKDALYLAVSQSGETWDTLAAVEEVQRKGGRVFGVCNVVGSSIARACAGGIYVHAGPEVSVTSTKTFTSTLVAFALLALHVGRIRDMSPARGAEFSDGLRALPEQIQSILDRADALRELAHWLATHRSVFYIGRGCGLVAAREGAQKLKEVSYIHAEAYPASELKHGPLALIAPETPTVAIVPDDEQVSRNLSSLEEIRARRGQVLAIVQPGCADAVGRLADHRFEVPACDPLLAPILCGIPLQLLAYYSALELGRDVDRPRNLAKSVTVE